MQARGDTARRHGNPVTHLHDTAPYAVLEGYREDIQVGMDNDARPCTSNCSSTAAWLSPRCNWFLEIHNCISSDLALELFVGCCDGTLTLHVYVQDATRATIIADSGTR